VGGHAKTAALESLTVAHPPPDAAARRARRIDAIDQEIRALGDRVLGGAPAIIMKRASGRFRLPRSVKADLISRFVTGDRASPNQLTTLIIVAHPDDESIGAGARLRKLGDAWVVDVTDGAPRDADCAHRHGFDTPEEYARARREELDKAMGLAGLPPERLIRLDFADGEVTLRLAELCLRVTELIDDMRPDVVLTHPYEGGHTDHDATAFAVHLACGVLNREGVTPPAILELALYNAQNGTRVVQRFLPHLRADKGQLLIRLNAAERALKQAIFDCFHSQRSVLAQFSTEFEKFRPAPRYEFTRPPHEGMLNYERYGDPDRGRKWRAQAERVLRGLGMRKD
jgi:LmbE family N-acetylglucosaminyl deacetylase